MLAAWTSAPLPGKRIIILVKTSRGVAVLVALLALAVAAYISYAPARLFALAITGHSPVCPLSHALKSKFEYSRKRPDYGTDHRRQPSGQRGKRPACWNTPKGQYWIPKGNRYVLPFNLAEMERHIYGSGEHFVHAGDIVLDCGASDGDFTREALKAGASKVVSIEISPITVECLRRNLAQEIAQGQVVVYPKGVWDREDSLVLNVHDSNFAANSVVLRWGPMHATALKVPLTSIDKIVAELNLPKVDFIKMDVEGAEVRAIAGARATMAAANRGWRLPPSTSRMTKSQFQRPFEGCARITRCSAVPASKPKATSGPTFCTSISGRTAAQ